MSIKIYSFSYRYASMGFRIIVFALLVTLTLSAASAVGDTIYSWTDENGVLTKVNLIVGTTNNYAPIAMSIKKAASSLIKKGEVVTEPMLNMVEMAFRAYDPCFGCD